MSTFTQLLSSVILNVSFRFNVAVRPQRPYKLLGTGSPGRPPPLSDAAPDLAKECSALTLLGIEPMLRFIVHIICVPPIQELGNGVIQCSAFGFRTQQTHDCTGCHHNRDYNIQYSKLCCALKRKCDKRYSSSDGDFCVLSEACCGRFGLFLFVMVATNQHN